MPFRPPLNFSIRSKVHTCLGRCHAPSRTILPFNKDFIFALLASKFLPSLMYSLNERDQKAWKSSCLLWQRLFSLSVIETVFIVSRRVVTLLVTCRREILLETEDMVPQRHLNPKLNAENSRRPPLLLVAVPTYSRLQAGVQASSLNQFL